MKHQQALFEILNDTWAIHPDAAHPLLLQLKALNEGSFSLLDTEIFNRGEEVAAKSSPLYRIWKKRLPYAVDQAGEVYSEFDDMSGLSGLSLVIPIDGIITRGDLWSLGTQSLQEYLAYAESHAGIDQIVFHINSPGGMASGTHELAQAIKSHPKPSIALVSGMAASAAYWIASACDKIILVNELAQVGSIGVMTTLSNTRKYLEDMGIVIKDVYASQSSDKNADRRQFLETGNTDLIQAELDELCNFFINTVKSNRANAREDVFTGKVYRGADAIKMGLVDAISPIHSSTKPKPNTKTMSLKAIMAAVIGTKEITLSQEQFNEIVAVQEKATSQIDACGALFGEKSKQPGFDLFATIKEVVDENAALKTAAQDHAQIVTDLNAEIQSLKDERAEDPNARSTEGGDGGSSEPALTAWEKEMAAKKEMIKKRKEAAK